MTNARNGALPLLFGAGLLAVAAGLIVALRGPSSLPLRVGSPAPDLRLQALSGGEISLEELRGRVVFVNFWATFCPPCRTEAPSLERLYRELREEGLEVLAVSIDGAGARKQLEAFRGEFALSFPILLDPRKRLYHAYRVTGVPETFMIDPRGRLVEQFIGPRDWDDPRYALAVRRLLDPADEGQPEGGRASG